MSKLLSTLLAAVFAAVTITPAAIAQEKKAETKAAEKKTDGKAKAEEKKADGKAKAEEKKK
jgi:Ni/Co efflux regulator RcnB